jgi:antitoxin component of MazEF toxin-antitoxin module
MVKRLIQHGNSAALVIDKPILELLQLTFDTPFEMTTDGRNLILSPLVETAQENAISASLKRVNAKYGSVLKRLGE